MATQSTGGKHGGSKKYGRSGREPTHMSYNARHHYTARSNKKCTRHLTPLHYWLGAELENMR